MSLPTLVNFPVLDSLLHENGLGVRFEIWKHDFGEREARLSDCAQFVWERVRPGVHPR